MANPGYPSSDRPVTDLPPVPPGPAPGARGSGRPETPAFEVTFDVYTIRDLSEPRWAEGNERFVRSVHRTLPVVPETNNTYVVLDGQTYRVSHVTWNLDGERPEVTVKVKVL